MQSKRTTTVIRIAKDNDQFVEDCAGCLCKSEAQIVNALIRMMRDAHFHTTNKAGFMAGLREYISGLPSKEELAKALIRDGERT